MSGSFPSSMSLGLLSRSSASDRNYALKVQANYIDTYMHPPTRFDRSTYEDIKESVRLSSVPVVRIFGSTDQGQTVTAHVHGVFPYIYIEHKGTLDPDEGS